MLGNATFVVDQVILPVHVLAPTAIVHPVPDRLYVGDGGGVTAQIEPFQLVPDTQVVASTALASTVVLFRAETVLFP